jgi:hypothetical protein
LCGNAAEFILDPWVMIQLPWYPVMFHQWLAAVLSEVLKFEKEIVEFHHWPVADSMKTPIAQLFFVRARLRRALYCGFLYLHLQYSHCPDFEMEQDMVTTILDRIILFAAPYLRFLLSGNSMRLVMSLKNYLWTAVKSRGPFRPVARINNMYEALFDELHYLYNPQFWKSDGKAEKIFGKLTTDEFRKNLKANEEEWNEEFLENVESKVF